MYFFNGFNILEWMIIIVISSLVAAVTFFIIGIVINLNNKNAFRGKVFFFTGGFFTVTALAAFSFGMYVLIMSVGGFSF